MIFVIYYMSDVVLSAVIIFQYFGISEEAIGGCGLFESNKEVFSLWHIFISTILGMAASAVPKPSTGFQL